MLGFNIKKESIKSVIYSVFIRVFALSFLVIYLILTVQKVHESVQKQREQIQILADVVTSNVKAALLFKDTESAQQTLNALMYSSSVVYAVLSDMDKTMSVTLGELTDAKGWRSWNTIEYSTTVFLRQEKIGHFNIVISLTEMWLFIARELLIMALVMLTVLWGMKVVIRKMAEEIVNPINSLLATTSEIYRTGQYGLRTQKITDDEIGELADTFNNMLNVIEKRDDELRIAATTFNAQEAIIITDANRKIIKVNSAYSELTGEHLNDVQGSTPSILDPDYLEQSLVDDISDSLNKHGHWTGETVESKGGHDYPAHYIVTKLSNSKGFVTHYVITFTDISERTAFAEEIKKLAFFDPLTQLPNRRLLIDRLSSALKVSIRNREFGALVFLDIDKFKYLNDTKGHNYGDLLLIEVASRLSGIIREQDTVARLGGDEFVVMLQELGTDILQATQYMNNVGKKIVSELNKSYSLKDFNYDSSSSVGITLFNADSDLDTIFIQADMAMYAAKNAGRNTLRFFDNAMQQAVEEKVAVEQQLKEALKQQQFELHYQFLVNRDERVIGAEALIRWQHPDKGLVQPDSFINLVENMGLIRELGFWTLRTACQQLKEWQDNVYSADLVLAINISALEFQQNHFVDDVLMIVNEFQIDRTKLKLELTESVILHDVEFAIEQITRLKMADIAVAMDDFGSGYSSLSYLSQLPISIVKIDRSFISRMIDSEYDCAIIKMIIALGSMLGMGIIAEGVEEQAQFEILKELGCTNFQGYYFSEPVTHDEFQQLLQKLVG